MIANLAGPDLVILVVVILVVLVGGSQLPKIARNVGIAGKEFRKAQAEAEEEAERDRQAKAAREAAQAAQAAIPAPPAPAAPAAPATPAAGPAPAEAQPGSDPSITLTPAQLDAMLKAREEQVRREADN